MNKTTADYGAMDEGSKCNAWWKAFREKDYKTLRTINPVMTFHQALSEKTPVIPLHALCSDQQWDMVFEVLKDMPQEDRVKALNYSNDYNRHPMSSLLAHTKAEQVPIAQKLVEAGVNCQCQYFLQDAGFDAVGDLNLPLVEFFVNQGAAIRERTDGHNALHIVCGIDAARDPSDGSSSLNSGERKELANFTNMVEFLVDQGVDCNESSSWSDKPLDILITQQGPLNRLKVLTPHVDLALDQGREWPALFVATHGGNHEVMAYLVDQYQERGIDLPTNSRQESVLQYAVAYHDPAVGKKLTEQLIQKKVDLNHVDQSGNSALSDALAFGKPEAMRLLLEAGASPFVKTHHGGHAGFAALHKLNKEQAECTESHVKALTLLLEKIDPRGVNEQGQTMAQLTDSPAMRRVLLARTAELDKQDMSAYIAPVPETQAQARRGRAL